MIRSQRLKWDSDFFGVECGRIDMDGTVSEPDFELHLATLKTMDMVTIVNHDLDDQNGELIAKMTQGKLVDVNVQFVKKLPGAHQKGVSAVEKYSGSEKLTALAESAFTVSRFTQDPKLRALGGANVYREWVKNAYNKLGKYFVVLGDADAFSLFHIDGNALVLELIAVNPSHQKSGLGTLMWQVLEREARHLGAREIHVGTQLQNFSAMKFYHKMGCTMVSTAQVYHWWQR